MNASSPGSVLNKYLVDHLVETSDNVADILCDDRKTAPRPRFTRKGPL